MPLLTFAELPTIGRFVLGALDFPLPYRGATIKCFCGTAMIDRSGWITVPKNVLFSHSATAHA
jgi:hypothetical protein